MYHILKKNSAKSLLSLLLIFVALVLSFLFADEISRFVKLGLKLCVSSIVGTVFPFIIITDIIYHFSEIDRITPFKKIFEQVFKINGIGLRAFVAGAICGFPLGVKVATDLYYGGVITKEECERLIAFSNNTGPAFVISAVGSLMRGSLREGIILYFSMIISAIIVGYVLGIGKTASAIDKQISLPEYSFVNSIKDAGINTLTICSFITFFSVIMGFLSYFLPPEIYITVAPFLEVGNAAKILSSKSLNPLLSLALTSFAISFSGISVMAQAKVFLGEEIKMKKYTPAKILQGCISVLICLLLYTCNG